MKLMGFIPASMHASVVPSNPNNFKIAKVNTTLSITPIGHSVDIRQKGSTLVMSAVKQDVNRFFIFDRTTRSTTVLTKGDILENYDVEKPALPFTDKDKKKSEKMKLFYPAVRKSRYYPSFTSGATKTISGQIEIGGDVAKIFLEKPKINSAKFRVFHDSSTASNLRRP